MSGLCGFRGCRGSLRRAFGKVSFQRNGSRALACLKVLGIRWFNRFWEGGEDDDGDENGMDDNGIIMPGVKDLGL